MSKAEVVAAIRNLCEAVAESWPAELVNADGNDRQILADVTRWQARNRIDHYLHYLQDGTRKYPGGKFPKVHKMDNQQMAAIGRIMASKARTLADARPEWNVEIEKTINWLQWDKRSPEGELRSD